MSEQAANGAASVAGAPSQTNGSRRGRALRGIGLVIGVIALVALAWYFFIGQYEESTDDAYVSGNLVQITPQVAGTVVFIGADDTQLVRQGQVLARLDAADADVALSQAQASLADAVRSARGLYVARTQAEALIAQRISDAEKARTDMVRARIDLERAQEDFNRRNSLAAEQAVSAEELQHARQALETARSALRAVSASQDAAQAQLRQAQQQLSAANVQVDNVDVAHHPRVLLAAARLKEAYLAGARASIVAPVSGYVVKRSVQVGQRVAPGAMLMALVPLDQVWVDANFKETQLSLLRIGQPVKLVSDFYGSHVTYEGTVYGLGVGTGASLALLPAQNATGNWIKIVQRLPVRIAIKPEQVAQHPLRVGLSMRVTVDLHNTDGPMLAAQPASGFDQSTKVFEAQAKAADQLVAKIIAANGGQRQ